MHFAPTERARQALVREGIRDATIFVTGNPVVDAIQQIRQTAVYRATTPPVHADAGERLILVTLHRRESWGERLAGMCAAIRDIVERHRDVRVAFPVHLNPRVGHVVRDVLADVDRVSLVEPLDYLAFIAQMEASTLILTDSGGVQEEAPTLGRPVLVLRETTERPEAVEQGTARLVGTSRAAIVAAATELLTNPESYRAMARTMSPFGDGHAAVRIADLIESRLAVDAVVA